MENPASWTPEIQIIDKAISDHAAYEAQGAIGNSLPMFIWTRLEQHIRAKLAAAEKRVGVLEAVINAMPEPDYDGCQCSNCLASLTLEHRDGPYGGKYIFVGHKDDCYELLRQQAALADSQEVGK